MGMRLVVWECALCCSIRQDMDEKEGKLMGAHNYCTQVLSTSSGAE